MDALTLQILQSIIAFASMSVGILTFVKARDEHSKKTSVETANLSFKIDSLAEKLTEMNASQRVLLDGYTSNEKRITILEHRVGVLNDEVNAIKELEGR